MRDRATIVVVSALIGGLALLSLGHAGGGAARASISASAMAPQSATLSQMIGQMVMARMTGTRPDARLLTRIRAGKLGGVIIYSDNVTSPGQLRSLTAKLQAAARKGRNPPLLISTDQEGGQVKRLPWAAPTLTPEQMGAAGGTVSAEQGLRTGHALRRVGINVDLAPVVDVAHSSAAFIWREGRSFGMSASRVVHSAIPFADGLEQSGVIPSAKHFPGVGGALTDTDSALQTINVGAADLAPYRAGISRQIPMIMVSTGIYPKLDPGTPAALSRPIVTGLLRDRLGFDGVVISDDLERPSGVDTSSAAARAMGAGVDIVLVSTTERAGKVAYDSMLAAARSGRVPVGQVQAAYLRVLELKHRFAGA